MLSKENYQEPAVENNTHLVDLDEAAEETLSLCDLPIYSDTTEWDNIDDFSKENYQSSSEEDQGLFEFSSQDFSTASTCPAENIIFCGKLIPHKQPPVSEEKTQKLNKNNTEQYPKKRGAGLSHSKTTSFNKSRTSRSDGVKDQYTNNKFNNKSKLQQVSSSKSLTLEKYPAKPRWNLMMFGLISYPTEMELSDIRKRQRRRTPSSSIQSFPAGGEDVRIGKSSSRGKGFWRLLKVLGCGNQTANAVVKASLGVSVTFHACENRK